MARTIYYSPVAESNYGMTVFCPIHLHAFPQLVPYAHGGINRTCLVEVLYANWAHM